MAGFADMFKKKDPAKEEEIKNAEAEIRAKPEYKKALEDTRMVAMMVKDREKIRQLYASEKKKTPLAGTAIGGMFNTMASAANAEFTGKQGQGGFVAFPTEPEWMKKKKKEG